MSPDAPAGTTTADFAAPVEYAFEAKERIRVGFIGAGGHSFRNIYPSLQYAPVELVSVCDLDASRAETRARMFGADRHYSDHRKMLEVERLDAVFIVTSYTEEGGVQAVDLAVDCLSAQTHVWMEKPTGASVADIERLSQASDATERFVMTGMKKMFTPAIEQVKRIIDSPGFGRPSSLFVRYPISLPEPSARADLVALRGFLDHIYHPGAIIQYLFGPVHRLIYEWEPQNGGAVASLKFMNGAIGQLHLAAGASGSSPLERVEVIGEAANVIVDNGVVVTYYRRAPLPTYGRSPTYLVDEKEAPLRWEPEFSLGQLCNKNLFYLGYAPEIRHFCESVLAERAPTKGTLNDALEIVKLFEAFRYKPEGQPVVVNDLPDAAASTTQGGRQQ